MTMQDSLLWTPIVRVIKYNSDTVADLIAELGKEPCGSELRAMEDEGRIAPDEVVEVEGNALVNTGLQRLGDLIIGTGQAFTTTRGVSGVGNGTAATTSGMTALQGASQLYKALDGAPTSVTGVLSAATTYGTSEANFAWEEWCWAIATATPVTSATFNTATTSGIMVNRKAQALGTKASGAVWTLQATITLS